MPLTAYERTVAALASGSKPSFSDDEGLDVMMAIQGVFASYGYMSEEILQRLTADVVRVSAGRFNLRPIGSDRFRFRVKGLGVYAELQDVAQGTTQRIIFGPYAKPVVFDGDPAGM